MTGKLLDGKYLSVLVQESVRNRVRKLRRQFGRAPGLGVILVGDNPASRSYVASKEKIAQSCGLETYDVFLPGTSREDQIADAIKSFNANDSVDGILLQLPLPPEISESRLIELIDPKKDADGLHPLNQGLMLAGRGALRPCTPMGCMALIDLAYSPVQLTQPGVSFDDINTVGLAGKTAIVIGRSILVGKPVMQLLLERNATVICAHSKSPDLPSLCRQADIVVAAVGKPRLVDRHWIKPGAVVIDVGINRLDNGKLVGDVNFDSVSAVAGAITPVPGGVGPMTVVMLVQNTLRAFMERVAEC